MFARDAFALLIIYISCGLVISYVPRAAWLAIVMAFAGSALIGVVS